MPLEAADPSPQETAHIAMEIAAIIDIIFPVFFMVNASFTYIDVFCGGDIT